MRNRILIVAAGLCLSTLAFSASAGEATEFGHQAEHPAEFSAHPSEIEAGFQRVAHVDTFANHEAIPMSVRAKFYLQSKNLSTHIRPDKTEGVAARLNFKAVHGNTVDADGKFVSCEQACDEKSYSANGLHPVS